MSLLNEHAIIFNGNVNPGFDFWLHYVFCMWGIVQETGGRSTGRPGGSLPSVDRSPGSPRRCLCIVQAQTTPDQGILTPVDHLELLVLSLGQHDYSTKTLACITVRLLG